MVRDAWLAESSSEYMFVNSLLVKDMKESIRTDVCYRKYQEWCNANNRTPDDERIFGKVLATMGITKIRPRDGDKRYHEYVGIGLPDGMKGPISTELNQQKTL